MEKYSVKLHSIERATPVYIDVLYTFYIRVRYMYTSYIPLHVNYYYVSTRALPTNGLCYSGEFDFFFSPTTPLRTARISVRRRRQKYNVCKNTYTRPDSIKTSTNLSLSNTITFRVYNILCSV